MGFWVFFTTAAALVPASGLSACGDNRDGGRPYLGDTDAGQMMPSDGGDGDGSGGDAGDPDAQMTASSPVLVGIEANPSAVPAGQMGAVSKLEAELTAIAAGVRVSVLRRAWRDMNEITLAEMEADAAFYGVHGVEIFVNIAFVDRLKDERPDALAGAAWDSPELKDGLKSAIDDVFAKLGKSVHALYLGNDVDVFLDAHPQDKAAMSLLLEQACAYARSHPKAADDLRVGVALSPAAVLSPAGAYADLLAISDMAVLSYRPGLGTGELPPPSAVGTDLDSMIVAVGGMPIVLDPVSFPSGVELGSSAEKQSSFYESFFKVLGPRRNDIGWINIAAMHDPPPDACAAYAEAQGQPKDGPFAAYVCSLGLSFGNGEKKPAWQQVLSGTAAFAVP